MSFFQELNSNVLVIEKLLLADQDLCKYLYYNTLEPLSEPTIANTKLLMMENIFPLPKTPNAKTKKMSLLNYYIYNAEPWSSNSGFKKLYLGFDIICHLDLWMITNALRPYGILNRIDNMFNNKHIAELSSKNVFWDGIQVTKYSDKFYGYHMIYDLTHNSNICGRDE